VARADELAETDAERACLGALRSATGEVDGPMERHCVRQFLIAERLGEQAGEEVDRELLLCAAFLHDAGIYPSVSTGDVYVTDGRRLAERTLQPFGWQPDRLALCLDSIEQHHAVRSRWSWGTEVELMRQSDLIEVTRGLVAFGLSRSWLNDVFRQVPRNGFWRALGPLIVSMLRERPASMLRIATPQREPTPPRSPSAP
jgi:hypothetical protein